MAQDRGNEFARLMAEVQNGSTDAVRRLLDGYSGHIYRAIRRTLSRKLRSKFDSDDFAQAVWASFFANYDACLRFSRPERLIGFLARMARNKVIDEGRKRLPAAERERSLDWSEARGARMLTAAAPRPSTAISASEQWKQVIAGQPSYYRRVAELRAGGATQQEIATELQITERTVRRVLRRLQQRAVECDNAGK